MHHFFLTPESIQGKQVSFPPQVAHQIRHVLRLGAGDQVAVLDNSGMLFTVVLTGHVSNTQLTGQIVASHRVTSEPGIGVTLFFGLSNREKVEWILQKGTEIGVSKFYPFVSSRTRVSTPALSESRITRWKQIIKEAAEQSGRGKLPTFNPPEFLKECFVKAKHDHQMCLLAWENSPGDEIRLKELLQGFSGDAVALFVGPEGGFSEDEIVAAKENGCQVVSLGPRILRMETAAIVFPALVLYEFGGQ